ncbi:MAG: hydroxymethylbilane synthase [Thermoplasmata archaeon]
MTDPVRIGSRASPLALAQASSVATALRTAAPDREVSVVPLRTAGDRSRRSSGGLDFTGALEVALRDGRIDLAVHSAKDLPSADPPDLPVLAYPARADPRDCVVASRWPLPSGALLATSSLRRRAQWLRLRPDLRIVPIRGNVDTRIAQVASGRVDAVVLARAGLLRLRRADAAVAVLPILSHLPSPAQGILAVQGRRGDREIARLARTVDDPAARVAAVAEREVARALGANCDVALGAWARLRDGRLRLDVEWLSEDGRLRRRARGTADPRSARRLARSLARRLRLPGETP